MSHRALERRQLGATAVRLPVLGVGTAPLGNLYQPIEESSARLTIETALAAGIRYFDTAPFYGFGLSEGRLGSVLGSREEASTVLLSTKVGRVLTPLPEATLNTDRNGFVQSLPNAAIFDYSHDGVMRSFDASMQRLRVSGVAVLLAHDLGRLTHGGEHESRMRDFLDGGYKAMQALRAQGRVGAIGIGVNEIEVCQDLLQRVELDCVLLAGRYTLLEQGAIESLLPECLRRRVGVIIGGPFNSGVLVESAAIDYVPHYNYAPAPASIVQRARRLRDTCAAHGVPIGAAALQFPLAHAAVVSVIPGVRSPEQVQEAIRFMDSPIPAALWHELRHAGLLNPAAPAPSPGIG